MKKDRGPPNKKQRIAIEHNWQLLMLEGARRQLGSLFNKHGLIPEKLHAFHKLCDELRDKIKETRDFEISKIKVLPNEKR